MIEIDFDYAVKLLTELVDEFGADYIYKKDEREILWDGSLGSTDCHYILGDEPSCGVGHALVRAGVLLGEFEGLEGMCSSIAIRELSNRGILDATQEARNVFGRFQILQDGGTPWGEALKAAVNR